MRLSRSYDYRPATLLPRNIRFSLNRDNSTESFLERYSAASDSKTELTEHRHALR